MKLLEELRTRLGFKREPRIKDLPQPERRELVNCEKCGQRFFTRTTHTCRSS